jgi:hypothetical protein
MIDLAPAVQAAIARSAAGGAVGKIEEQRQGDQIICQTEITNLQGKRRATRGKKMSACS